jgi:hypothetical protein
MPVTTVHKQYQAALSRWRMVRDATEGQEAIKRGKAIYLPDFIAEEDEARYAQYLQRAYYLGVTGRTKAALVGMIFRNDPSIEVPEQMQPIIENADGAGQSVVQLAKSAAGEILQTGRYGLLADYPQADEGLDAETEARLGLRPTIAKYPAESIINWRTEAVNGRTLLTLVVLRETVEKEIDEFTTEEVYQYRVLILSQGVYVQRIYNEEGDILSERVPRQAGGATFDHIPFYIVGSENNDPSVDSAPLYDLAMLNIAHYQTTADHRENLFIHGQLTLGVTTSLSPEQWTTSNPNGLLVGSRKGVYLGENGGLHSVTAPESSSLRIALQDLRDEMVNIGARIITNKGQNETAEAARLNAASESSTLDMMVGNMSEAFEAALEDCARFIGVNPDQVFFSLNREFFDQSLTAQEIMAGIQLMDSGVLSKQVMRDAIRKGRLRIAGDLTDEEIDAQIEESGL